VSARDWAAKKVSMQQAQRKLALMPKSETGRGAAVPFPFADRKVIHEAHSNEEINSAIKKAPVVDIPLQGLRAIQHSVKPHRVDQYLRDPGLRPPGDLHNKARTPVDHPIIIQQGGKRYIWDGHHRTTASKLRGDKSVKARLVDFDAR
jgi:hypothetical protein